MQRHIRTFDIGDPFQALQFTSFLVRVCANLPKISYKDLSVLKESDLVLKLPRGYGKILLRTGSGDEAVLAKWPNWTRDTQSNPTTAWVAPWAPKSKPKPKPKPSPAATEPEDPKKELVNDDK